MKTLTRQTNDRNPLLALNSDQLQKARDWIAELAIAEEAASFSDAQVQRYIARCYDNGLEGFIYDSAAF